MALPVHLSLWAILTTVLVGSTPSHIASTPVPGTETGSALRIEPASVPLPFSVFASSGFDGGEPCDNNGIPWPHGQPACRESEENVGQYTIQYCFDGEWEDTKEECNIEEFRQRSGTIIVTEDRFRRIRDGVLQSLSRNRRDPNLWYDLEFPGEGRYVTIEGVVYQYLKGLWVRQPDVPAPGGTGR